MRRPTLHRGRRSGRRVAAIVAAFLAALLIVGPVAASQSWTVTANTIAVPLGTSTDVRLTITNTSTSGELGDRLRRDPDSDPVRYLRSGGGLGVRACLVGFGNQLAPRCRRYRGHERRPADRRPRL